jgi:hypothetical protein
VVVVQKPKFLNNSFLFVQKGVYQAIYPGGSVTLPRRHENPIRRPPGRREISFFTLKKDHAVAFAFYTLL